ncbi:hypothetical protein K458DRAFT_7805 [Lentithecium fluviatile CBS 122367]|uniref:Uncharacterized protein n=1 Tax=Lentithecium fluviatile CBS 122367 TaxID=1168545 RepID=A0A6G1JMX8_9PLEO|nr:hypothetical protein K458DRAFT_7805 [Lentithecium fluviatile CBS 122367]
MLNSIIISFSVVAQALSAAALSQSYSCHSPTTSENQSQAQIHNENVLPDHCSSQFSFAGLEFTKPAYIKTTSSSGSGAQSQPQQEDSEANRQKSEPTSQSSDDEHDNYTLDSSGCPDLTKNRFHCLDCGGKDEKGKCKGDPADNNAWAGCTCIPDPDFSINPPGLVRPGLRERRREIRFRRLLLGDEVEGHVSRSDVATVAVSTLVPTATMSVLPCFTMK